MSSARLVAQKPVDGQRVIAETECMATRRDVWPPERGAADDLFRRSPTRVKRLAKISKAAVRARDRARWAEENLGIDR